MKNYIKMKIKWLGHASFEIETGGKVIYLDPYKITKDAKKADMILISHDHYDHCDTRSVKKIKKDDTWILTSENAAKKFSGNIKVMGHGDEFDFGDISIRTIPAYNIGKPFHPKGTGLGFVLESKGKRVYHAGDTDLIPEMGLLDEITVALLPIGGTYTMNVKEAVEAAKMINPKIAVPMHYGEIVGSKNDAIEFKKLVEKETYTVSVIILEGRDLEI